LKYVVLVMVLGNLALMACVFLGAVGPKPAPMPNPNGFDDFVKAVSMMRSTHKDFWDMSQPELKAFFTTNAPAMERGRRGLSRECRTPSDYSNDFMGQFIYTGMNVKELALAFNAQGKLAMLEGRTNDAVECYLDCIKVGEKFSHGAFMRARLVGIAYETIGRNGLQQFKTSLPEADSRKLALTLETIDDEEEPVENIWSHEKQYIRKGSSLKQKILESISWQAFIDLRKMKQDFIGKCQTNTLQHRQLMLTFAARAYELDKGKPPASTADLVPDYLKRIPQDPATGTNLVYHH
jgi:hypothetical protein